MRNLGRLVLTLHNRLHEMTSETVVNKDVKGRARRVGPQFVRTRLDRIENFETVVLDGFKFQTPNCGVQRDIVGAFVRPKRGGDKEAYPWHMVDPPYLYGPSTFSTVPLCVKHRSSSLDGFSRFEGGKGRLFPRLSSRWAPRGTLRRGRVLFGFVFDCTSSSSETTGAFGCVIFIAGDTEPLQALAGGDEVQEVVRDV